jgi:hypothetical protein
VQALDLLVRGRVLWDLIAGHGHAGDRLGLGSCSQLGATWLVSRKPASVYTSTTHRKCN